jgi:hypothetical protein
VEKWRKKPLEIPRRGWKNNSKMELKNLRWEGMDCISLAQDRGNWRAAVGDQY